MRDETRRTRDAKHERDDVCDGARRATTTRRARDDDDARLMPLAGNRFLNPTHPLLYTLYAYIAKQGVHLSTSPYFEHPLYRSKPTKVRKTRPRGKIRGKGRRPSVTRRRLSVRRDVSVDILLRRRSMHLKAHLRRVARVSHDGGPRRVDARVRARRREEPRGERARVWCVVFFERASSCVVVCRRRRASSSCVVAVSSFVVFAHARCVVVRVSASARERFKRRDARASGFGVLTDARGCMIDRYRLVRF